MTKNTSKARPHPQWVIILWLMGLALAIRIVVLAAATAFGPTGSMGDLAYHSLLVGDPIRHLRNSPASVSQYAPYLGILEWVSVKPWLAMGVSETTALRLGSITWDLVGMFLLLIAIAKRFPEKLVFGGLMWAASPLLWPASAYLAQDELIAAALVSAVVLLLFTHRRCAAVVVCTLGLFLAKILLVPVLLAILLTSPRESRLRLTAAAALTLVLAASITWLLSGTDGLTQQAGYSVDVVGFSMSIWSTLFLHQYVSARTAIRLSVVLVVAGLAVAMVVWSRRRVEGLLEAPRLAAALLFVTFAVLGISNPEYLAIAAPVAIVGCIGLEPIYQAWVLVVAATLAWAVNGAYYLLRLAYDPTGALLGVNGFDVPGGRRVVFLDLTHQALLMLFLYFALLLARNYLVGSKRLAVLSGDQAPST